MTLYQNSQRTGRYIKQPSGYRAFVPESLPPKPGIDFDDELLDLLSNADRAIGRLDGCAEMLPDSDRFVFMYIRKEAVLSSQIEGTQASLMDVLEYEAAVREATAPDVGDVFNYVAAMDHGLKRLDTLPLSMRLIREIHAKLLLNIRGSGEFRTSQNWIGPSGSTLRDAFFVPPPPSEIFPALGDLEKFIHGTSPMPYLLRAGIAHAQFETIHPFLDGNGRVGRLLITFMLCERKILRKPLLYLSFFFKKHRSEYYERLQAVRDRGEWEQWLKFFLSGVAEVAEDATATARKIVSLREKHRKSIVDNMGRSAGRGIRLLESLYRSPVVSIAHIAKICAITFQGASDIAHRFSTLGVLKETTGQKRHRLFAYAPYLALLGEPVSRKSRNTLASRRGPAMSPANHRTIAAESA